MILDRMADELIGPEDRDELRKIFAVLHQPVTARVVADAEEDADLHQLMDELAATTDGKLIVEHLKPGALADLPIDGAPLIALSSADCRGKVYLYGLPVGYEMSTLVTAIADLGGKPADKDAVSPEAQAALDALEKDVRLDVYSTPT
jgi:alkyl hydroperoxide reductase subunit AhpF